MRIAIIGGGITGLTAAHHFLERKLPAAQPLEVTLFEASSQLGGVMGTRRVGDYLVETGADSFITTQPAAVDLCRRLGLADELIPTDATYRRSLVLFQGKPVEVPDSFQLLSPVKIGPLLQSPLFTVRGKLRMALEYVLPRGPVQEDESLAHFVRRRFGQEALERLVQPLVGGIYTSDPEKLSLRATMPRFLEMEQACGSVIRALRQKSREEADNPDAVATGARYGLFLSLKSGISSLLNRLTDRVSAGGTIRRECGVARVQPIGGTGAAGFELELANGTREVYDRVILAVPAYLAADLVCGFAPAAAAELRGIEYASTAIVVTGHRLADISHPLNAFGLVVPAIERRQILAVSFASRKFPGRVPEGRVLLRTFVGGAMQPELFQLSDDELKPLVRRELAEILGVRGEPEITVIARWRRAMPQYHVGHLDRVSRIEAVLAPWPGLALAGNAYRGVGLPDCIASGERAAEKILGQPGSSR